MIGTEINKNNEVKNERKKHTLSAISLNATSSSVKKNAERYWKNTKRYPLPNTSIFLNSLSTTNL